MKADETIAAQAAGEIGPGGIIVTCSYSQTARQVLLELKPKAVRIGEGHKLGDGVRLAKEISAKGLKVEVVPDGALPVAMQGASAVVIGADQILGDGSVVNRCSTFSLALAAAHFEVPSYVVAQRIKLTGRDSAPIEESGDIFHDLPPDISVYAPLFDVTPAKLIHRIITESGPMTPEEAGAAGRDTANKLKSYVKAK